MQFPSTVDSENRFRRGIQKEPDFFLALMQGLLSAFAVRDFLFQFERAFVDAPLQILARTPQFRVAVLNLLQHFVEAVNQNADFIFRIVFRHGWNNPWFRSPSSSSTPAPGSGSEIGRCIRAAMTNAPRETADDNQSEEEQISVEQLRVFDRVTLEEHGRPLFRRRT